MSYFDFKSSDIIQTKIVTNPVWTVTQNNNQITGSIYLEKNFLDPSLQGRQVRGFSEKLGGLVTKYSVITASISFQNADVNGLGDSLYGNINNLFNYYSLISPHYNLFYNFAAANQLRVINVPQIYYDNQILSGTFNATDHDSFGSLRSLKDDGRGGIFDVASPSDLIGNIFYSEGIVVLKAPAYQDFASVSPDSFKWQVKLKGIHSIPVAIFRCRAPAGQLNASTNPTFYYVPQTGPDSNTRQVLTSSLCPYITTVGLYDAEYQLAAIARLAQPIKKLMNSDIGINLKIDF